MTLTLDAHMGAIARAPAGPQVLALFDMDRTLIEGFSATDVLGERLSGGDTNLGDLSRSLLATVEFMRGRLSFVDFVNVSARELAGRSDNDNRAFAQRVFDRRVARRIFPESRALVAAHRARGHTVAIVSSATPYQVEPVARDLGIDHVLCTRLEIHDGLCTGRVMEPACYGPGKLTAAAELAEARRARLEDAWFYSDGIEDLPLLAAVGRPVPLNPGARLAREARRRHWPVLRWRSRGRPGVEELVRTGLVYGTLFTAGGIGFADLLLNRDPRHARNVAGAIWSELAAAAIDLELNITGENHLWERRPAVFTFNHQSALDALVMAKLLRVDYTGIAKKEIRNNPILGPALSAAGVIFVDRANSRKAIAALGPAVDALRSGTSIVIAPEGTRSPTNKLGRFKRGAFHLAMQAGVPIVPVVIYNSTDRMPKGALTARRGSVDVEVLPPVDTTGWSRDSVARHAAEVRDLYVRTLGEDGEAAP